MRVRLLTLRYCAALGGFDETPLAELLRDKEVLAFREHFFSVSDVPHLTCVVTYQPPVVKLESHATAPLSVEPASEKPSRGGRRPRASTPDAAAALGERERSLFESLRQWRLETARKDGVPPFVVFTNRHLVEIVRDKPASANALSNVDGIGAAKVRRYADAVLAILHGKKKEPARMPQKNKAAARKAKAAQAVEPASAS